MVRTRKATKAAQAANAAAKKPRRSVQKKVNHPSYKLMVCLSYTKHIILYFIFF